MNTKKNGPKFARTDDGRRYRIFEPAIVGEKPCPGEAHENGYIDHCMICLHHTWGRIPLRAEVDVVAEVERGFAVEARDASESFEPPPGVVLVSLTRKRCNFMAYVKA